MSNAALPSTLPHITAIESVPSYGDRSSSAWLQVGADAMRQLVGYVQQEDVLPGMRFPGYMREILNQIRPAKRWSQLASPCLAMGGVHVQCRVSAAFESSQLYSAPLHVCYNIDDRYIANRDMCVG